MRRILLSVCVLFSMLAFVACNSNPAIAAAEKFLLNPTAANLIMLDRLEGSLTEEEIAEYEEWCEEHEKELVEATAKIVLK